ncbi:uncharacterized protein LOC112528375 [Cynara cardunculus var. scolymus]|uniref:DUF868 domain-containing protein n=1 Tax=Cynara cardunculus var. scolymus TaxID=59895 RepID=A0A124SDB8_CYNCS|nr:uncharacterized protein LOC112528375 [Cynara cardunculus var. scolymus]KVH96460.1 Protein of unknown function DUF868, plant [Cynara cardunculus var. scolymus]
MSSSATHKRSSSSPMPQRRRTPLHHPSPPPPLLSSKPNLTTTLYHTHIGVFAVTWSRTLFGRSLYIHLLPTTTIATADDDDSLSSTTTTSTSSFHLQIKPFIFWNKHGSKKIPVPRNQNEFIHIYYDLSRAKFASGPEPISGFYIAAVISGQMALLIGDSPKQAYSKAKPTNPDKTQITVLRREHIFGIATKKYNTKATFRGKTRDITIDCTRIAAGEDSRLCFYVDNKRVLVVKHLNWKFRGNERVEMDGVHIQISWDVHNWLFDEEIEDGYALFMFRFEKSGFDYHEDDKYLARLNASGSGLIGLGSGFGFGFEKKKMQKGMSRTAAGSSSSSSLSSLSSGCGSVMEWESVEENELKTPSGFSLLVYAWKS